VERKWCMWMEGAGALECTWPRASAFAARGLTRRECMQGGGGGATGRAEDNHCAVGRAVFVNTGGAAV